MKQLMFLVLGLVVSGPICFAQSPKKVCNAKNQGRFWPEDANLSREIMQEANRSGELEMCSAVGWRRYRWQYLNVSVQRLSQQGPPHGEKKLRGEQQRTD